MVLREAAKKVIFLVAWPLRKNNFFEARKKNLIPYIKKGRISGTTLFKYLIFSNKVLKALFKINKKKYHFIIQMKDKKARKGASLKKDRKSYQIIMSKRI